MNFLTRFSLGLIAASFVFDFFFLLFFFSDIPSSPWSLNRWILMWFLPFRTHWLLLRMMHLFLGLHLGLVLQTDFFDDDLLHHWYIPAPDRKDDLWKLWDIMWASFDKSLMMHFEEVFLEELPALENDTTAAVASFEGKFLDLVAMVAGYLIEWWFH